MTEKWQRRTLICWAWPKAIEFDRKKKNTLNLTTTTKIHDWSWPNEKNIFNISTTTKINWILNFRSYSHNHFCRCWNFSVKFTKSVFSHVQISRSHSFGSYWIGQVNNPLNFTCFGRGTILIILDPKSSNITSSIVFFGFSDKFDELLESLSTKLERNPSPPLWFAPRWLWL